MTETSVNRRDESFDSRVNMEANGRQGECLGTIFEHFAAKFEGLCRAYVGTRIRAAPWQQLFLDDIGDFVIATI